MGSLFALLHNASSSLDVMQEAMGITQNNVANASTPGYVTQTLTLESQRFDPANNLWGGVQAGDVQSARSAFAEQAVWNASSLSGQASQQASSLSTLQGYFDVSGQTGVPAALNTLYAAFSAWSASPNDNTAKGQVLNAAQGLATAFNETAQQVEELQGQTVTQVGNTLTQINQLSAQIAQINRQIRSNGSSDAGLNAQLYNSLEQLSGLTSISVQQQSDGTVNVLMGGQTPLVTGAIPAQLVQEGSAGAVRITENGQDVTSTAAQGQLGALLQFGNQTLKTLLGGGAGSLNQLAQGVATAINNEIEAGQTNAGMTAAPLFNIAAGQEAATIAVNPAITATQLAANDGVTANGVPDALANLANTPQVNGMTFMDGYSSIATAIGNQASTALTDKNTQAQVLTQAQNARAQVSGVSLNQQAVQLMEYQQDYQASAQLISAVNSTIQGLMQTMSLVEQHQ